MTCSSRAVAGVPVAEVGSEADPYAVRQLFRLWPLGLRMGPVLFFLVVVLFGHVRPLLVPRCALQTRYGARYAPIHQSRAEPVRSVLADYKRCPTNKAAKGRITDPAYQPGSLDR